MFAPAVWRWPISTSAFTVRLAQVLGKRTKKSCGFRSWRLGMGSTTCLATDKPKKDNTKRLNGIFQAIRPGLSKVRLTKFGRGNSVVLFCGFLFLTMGTPELLDFELEHRCLLKFLLMPTEVDTHQICCSIFNMILTS